MVDPAGLPPPAPLFLDETEVRRAEKKFLRTASPQSPPPPRPSPLSEGLEPPQLGKLGLLLYTALYLGLGPQFASGFS